MIDLIEAQARVELAVWEHLNAIGPGGTWHVFQACKAWQEAHGFAERDSSAERSDPEPDGCDCEEREP